MSQFSALNRILIRCPLRRSIPLQLFLTLPFRSIHQWMQLRKNFSLFLPSRRRGSCPLYVGCCSISQVFSSPLSSRRPLWKMRYGEWQLDGRAAEEKCHVAIVWHASKCGLRSTPLLSLSRPFLSLGSFFAFGGNASTETALDALS